MNNSGQTYVIVTSEDNHFAIPKIWFLVQNNLSFGNPCVNGTGLQKMLHSSLNNTVMLKTIGSKKLASCLI